MAAPVVVPRPVAAAVGLTAAGAVALSIVPQLVLPPAPLATLSGG